MKIENMEIPKILEDFVNEKFPRHFELKKCRCFCALIMVLLRLILPVYFDQCLIRHSIDFKQLLQHSDYCVCDKNDQTAYAFCNQEFQIELSNFNLLKHNLIQSRTSQCALNNSSSINTRCVKTCFVCCLLFYSSNYSYYTRNSNILFMTINL